MKFDVHRIEWLTESDADGASQIVARDVPRWFGNLVVAALASQPEPLDVGRIAETFHDALCTVSHHDKPEVYRAAMGHDQPCRVKFANIAARLTEAPPMPTEPTCPCWRKMPLSPGDPLDTAPDLDVERLAASWAHVMDGRRIGASPGLAARISGGTTNADDWQAIAAEYLALLPTTTEPGS